MNLRSVSNPIKVLTIASILWLCLACGPEPPSELRFAGEWPQWRGPSRDGHFEAVAKAGDWPDEPREVWRERLGPGFSSVAISGGRLLTLEAKGGQEWLLALDAETGARLWRQAVGERYESFHGDGPRSTPAIDGEVAVAMGALGNLVAVDVVDGSERWRHELLKLAGGDREDWGFASSPLIVEDRVFVHGAEAVTALALDLESGEILWRLDQGPGGYASPLLAEIDGRPQVLSFLGAGLFGLDPANGDVLWRQDWETYYDLNAADPVLLSATEIFISSNYATGGGLIELSGGVPATRWKNPRVRNHWSSSVAVGGTIFGFDKTFLIAVDPRDGRVLWKQRGFGEGSVLASGDMLIVIGEDGQVALARASKERYLGLRRYENLVEGPVRAASAIADGRLFIRGKSELAVYELSEQEPTRRP